MADISFSQVPAGAISSNTYIEELFKRASLGSLTIPQKVAVTGQYNNGKSPTDYKPKKMLSADHAGQLYGFGSMLFIMVSALFAARGTFEITAFPIPDDGSAVAATWTIQVTSAATGSGTIALYIAGKRAAIGVANGDAATAIAQAIKDKIDASPNLPVTATIATDTVTLTANWAGETGNDISVQLDLLDGDDTKEPAGVAMTITANGNGATDPSSVQSALDELGDTHYTLLVNPYSGSSILSEIEAVGEARIDAAVRKPLAPVIGYTDTLANYLTFLGSRNSPWTTTVPVEGSPNLPFEVAAAAVGEAARSAQADPARPFKSLVLRNILPGSATPWTISQRESVEAAGGSVTIVNSNSQVQILDMLTTYTENAQGAADDSWRYTVTIQNIAAKYYSMDTVFASDPFTQAKVVDNDAITAQPYAIRPKTVSAYIRRLVDELWIPQAWSKDRDTIVSSITAQINSGNAGRIDVEFTDVIAAGLRIVAIKYNWSFQAAA